MNFQKKNSRKVIMPLRHTGFLGQEENEEYLVNRKDNKRISFKKTENGDYTLNY